MGAGVVFPVFALAPLMVAALCFYIAFECGIPYGFVSAATALLTSFFLFSGAVINITFLFAAFIAVPYAFMAVFLKRLDYSKLKKAVLRAVSAAALFNGLFAVIVWVFTNLWAEFLFGADLTVIFDRLGGAAAGYIILAAAGTIFIVVYDYMFLLAVRLINQRIRFLPPPKKAEEETKEPFEI